ncbi:MAG: TerB family tellurite resistance protein [Crocinitomicaceae bacterium]|nr:TerB family tellurite resistance protein [Crocinitomicaceae bacterium]
MLGFIIFGTRGVRSNVQEGQFYCPQCDGQTRFKQKKVTQFFTLYFIPLIPLGNKGTYVECQSCRNTFIDRILEMHQEIDITDRPEPKRRIEQQPEVNELEHAFGEYMEAHKKLTLAEKLAAEEQSLASETQGIAPKGDIQSEKQKVIKKLLIMMILADGKVEDSEIHMFHKVYRKTTGAAVADVYQEIEKVRSEYKPPYQYLKQVAAYLNDEGKIDIIKASMMIAAADGDIDATEISMVQNFGKALELKPAQLRVIIDSVTNS